MTMKNFVIKHLQATSVLLFLLVTLQSSADLKSLSDNALSDEALGEVTGQALFKIEEDTTPNAEGITFTKLTLGLEIAMNVNIDELNVGRYYREGGDDGINSGSGINTCMSGQHGRFCGNNNANVGFNEWRCTENKCGGIDQYTNDGTPFSASALVYGDLIGLNGAKKREAALASMGLFTKENHYKHSAPFTRSGIFPSEFEHTSDTDIRLRDMTFGRIKDNPDGTQTMEDFIIQKPFIQFAHEDVTVGSETVRKIAGLRLGFGSSTGVQGQAIDAVSGFIRPVIDVSVDAGTIGVIEVGKANFTFAPYLGGVRTVGFIDTDPTRTLVAPCSGANIVCKKVGNAADIAIASPQAQLFPMQNLVLDDSPAVWLSVQSKDVNYPSDTVDVKQDKANPNSATDSVKFDYETAKAGFWFNLGALGLSKKNGANFDDVLQQVSGTSNYTSASLAEFNRISGIQGKTAKPLHPDNYFNAHPNNLKYPNTNNYY